MIINSLKKITIDQSSDVNFVTLENEDQKIILKIPKEHINIIDSSTEAEDLGSEFDAYDSTGIPIYKFSGKIFSQRN